MRKYRQISGGLGLEVTRSLKRFLSSLSLIGSVFGLLCFAASLTPSLLPRPFAVQGVLSGVVFILGYGVGWVLGGIWAYLELPLFSRRIATWVATVPLLVSATLAAFTLGRVTDWQNAIRSLMDMEPVTSVHPFRIVIVAILTSLVLLLVSRILIWLGQRVLAAATRVLPRRIAALIAVILIVSATVSLVNKVVLGHALQAVDAVFAELNDLIEPDLPQPQKPEVSGSDASLLNWRKIGRRGREFVVTGPTAEEITALTGRPAKTPLRVYAGFEKEEQLDVQADLALEELIRLRAFDRAVLIVATPTGTGWLDPAGVDTIEVLHGGDTAIVALQYSYLPSWTTLMIDPDRSRVAARALFVPIYRYWHSLPKESRPKLYLFGLSLGALGSEHSANLVELLNDPVDGALWSGPPFLSTLWRQIMMSPELEGPAWLPRLPDNRLVRFAGPEGIGTPSREGWGNVRILYIQHASDPMSFFSPDLLWTRPRWLEDRGPDVSPAMQWNPLVFFFQVGFDVFLSTSVPIGYGHNFAPGVYIDGWLAITDPPGWPPDQVTRLKQHFLEQLSSD